MYSGNDCRDGVCGHDTHCVRCGHGIYFEVGPGLFNCPSCGENPDHTDEQLAQQQISREAASARALVSMQSKREKIEFLHNLKAGRSDHEVQMLDEIMDSVCMFEAAAVREGRPPMYENLT